MIRCWFANPADVRLQHVHPAPVGKVNEFTLPDISIDEVVFGVKAVDKDGNESLVTPYVTGPRPKRVIQTY